MFEWSLQALFFHVGQLGRFLSKEPVAPQVSGALSYNEYAYTANNPVTLQDSSGAVPAAPPAASPDEQAQFKPLRHFKWVAPASAYPTIDR